MHLLPSGVKYPVRPSIVIAGTVSMSYTAAIIKKYILHCSKCCKKVYLFIFYTVAIAAKKSISYIAANAVKKYI
jgi:hypothetical protein